MRTAIALLFAVSLAAGCKNVTVPDTAPTAGLAGDWVGYPVNYGASSTALRLSLTLDGSTISGLAIWDADYTMSGTLNGSAVTLNATSSSTQVPTWTFTGTLNGAQMTGNAGISGSTYAIIFYKQVTASQ
jgi:hypothetical protein